VLVTAAVVDDIPRDWLADRVNITLTDGDSGPSSAIVTEEEGDR
jgi:DNA replication and repair protein RecF